MEDVIPYISERSLLPLPSFVRVLYTFSVSQVILLTVLIGTFLIHFSIHSTELVFVF